MAESESESEGTGSESCNSYSFEDESFSESSSELTDSDSDSGENRVVQRQTKGKQSSKKVAEPKAKRSKAATKSFNDEQM